MTRGKEWEEKTAGNRTFHRLPRGLRTPVSRGHVERDVKMLVVHADIQTRMV